MEKKYRPNVAAVILAPSYPFDCRIFIAQRCDMTGIWQFPQGGIDEGETPQEALKRELEGTTSRKFYNFDGQTQKYFLVRLRPSAKININTKKPEFNEYKFINSSEVLGDVNHFKKPIYSKVIGYFKEKGFI